MKTIQQKLQSRIDRRRNFIRFAEEDLNGLKAVRHDFHNLHQVFGLNWDASNANAEIHEMRENIKALADDQKLDKQLNKLVHLHNYQRRHYGMSDV